MKIGAATFKDTHRENIPSNKTEALTKSVNMYISATGQFSTIYKIILYWN